MPFSPRQSLFKGVDFTKVTTPSRFYHVSYLSTGDKTTSAADDLQMSIDELLKEYEQVCLLTDENVFACYRQVLSGLEKKEGLLLQVVKSGEESKSRDTKAMVENCMFERQLTRNSALVAFGGGVVGDLGGYIAATYLRGIDFYQYPTSLLAMIDSSIGGKTGINAPMGKNLLGAIYQPVEVIIDVRLLTTLPSRELKNGMAEAIKVALAFDKDFF